MRIFIGVPCSAGANCVKELVEFRKECAELKNTAALEWSLHGMFWLVVTRSRGNSRRISKLKSDNAAIKQHLCL